MERLRVAFIGTGRISDLHALAYQDDDRADIVAVCDRSLELARTRGRRWGVAGDRIFSDYHEMLALPDIDLVEILLPHHLHFQATLDAVAAGKHVSVTEADGAVGRASRRNGRRRPRRRRDLQSL